MWACVRKRREELKFAAVEFLFTKIGATGNIFYVAIETKPAKREAPRFRTLNKIIKVSLDYIPVFFSECFIMGNIYIILPFGFKFCEK